MNTPKFKEGDWIKRKKDGRIAQVVMLLKTCYDLRLADGDGWWLDYDFQDNWELTTAPPKNKLEEAAKHHSEQYRHHWPNQVRPAYDSFIAGAKWQAEQLLKSSPLPEDTVIWNDGFKTGREVGARDMKEQMMKEAVEGTVYGNGEYTWVAGDIPSQFKYGDKVRIIIVKED